MKVRIILSFCLIGLSCGSATALAQMEAVPHVIKVRADSEIKVMPDKAVIVLGVHSRDSVMSIARNVNDAMTVKAIAIARKYGVTDDDISTEYYTVEPQYNDYNSQEFIGYLVKRMILIDLYRFEAFQDLMDDFLTQGIESVLSTRFEVSDPDKYMDRALSSALNKARARAEVMASEMGMKIGRVYSIEESYGGGMHSPNPGRGHYFPERGITFRDPLGGYETGKGSTTFGYLNATASVLVCFEIE